MTLLTAAILSAADGCGRLATEPLEPTQAATVKPTGLPTARPTPPTTEAPTRTLKHTEAPTNTPEPTEAPTNTPEPTEAPTNTPEPTEAPTNTPEPNILPDGFSYAREFDQTIFVELRYATEHNFTGMKADGYYDQEAAILRTEAARALGDAQKRLRESGLGLLIYDAYRPLRADTFFYEWSKNDLDLAKEEFYPNLDKGSLYKLGYIAKGSRHTMGASADLTLARLDDGEPLDMGGAYDLFDDRSRHDFWDLTDEQALNRKLLKKVMSDCGFTPYNNEWWHYSFPVSDGTLYDFDVR